MAETCCKVLDDLCKRSFSIPGNNAACRLSFDSSAQEEMSIEFKDNATEQISVLVSICKISPSPLLTDYCFFKYD